MLDHLEYNIRRVIADRRPQMLERAIENCTSRLDYIRKIPEGSKPTNMVTNDAKMVDMSPNRPPTWSPKMMLTWLYRQDFAKFSLNRHYNALFFIQLSQGKAPEVQKMSRRSKDRTWIGKERLYNLHKSHTTQTSTVHNFRPILQILDGASAVCQDPDTILIRVESMIEISTNSNEFRSKDGAVVRIPDADFNIVPRSVTKNTTPCSTGIRTTTICVYN
ncbi:hypothetical protein TNCV_3374601 [Trichonephila clavipes]|nr:hypothetical protein TNCV_3374601 [Trichonephila clavipes]